MKRKSTYFFLLFCLFQANNALAQCGLIITTSVTDVTCFNGTTGKIVVSVTGGTAPYQYQLAEAGAGAWQASNTFPSLAANTYPVSVKDASGCIQTIYTQVKQPTQLVAAYTATDPTCNASDNGTISITTTGGTSPYSYNWTKDGSFFSATEDLTGLGPGNYFLLVTDANSCITTPIITSIVRSISVTGFNKDVIANGNSNATSSTTAAIDNGGAVLYGTGYRNSNGTGSSGLPSSGSFNSAQDNNRPYQLGSYTSSNALVLRSSSGVTSFGGAGSGTLTFSTPSQSPYAQLYVVGTSGNGTGVVNYSVNYADGSTTTGSFTFPDWFLAAATASSARAIGGLDRVSYASPGTYDNSTNFNLFEAPITVTSPNLVVNSVTLTWASSSSTTSTSIFAITGYTSTTSGIRINQGVTTTVTPSVSVVSDATANKFCVGEPVTFTAVPVNGGASPTYQWRKNNSNIPGATGLTYTTSGLANNDKISVRMTSDLACVSTGTATSANQTMTTGTVPASVSVTADATSICSGVSTGFSATAVNGGASPAYQWKINGSNVPGATGSTFFSSSLNNGDLVSTTMTSTIGCATGSPASSNTVTMAVTPTAAPTVAISSVPSITFSSSITFGGSTPAYQWYRNGIAIPGANATTYFTGGASIGDIYALKLTSNYACKTAPAAMSNYITISSITLPVQWEWFTAQVATGNKVNLQWKTAAEYNNRQFLVQRSTHSSGPYQQIASIAATNAPQGSIYGYTDVLSGTGTYFYRILQEDIDGHLSFSETRSVTIAGNSHWQVIDLGSSWKLQTSKLVSYYLLDVQGRVVEKGTANGSTFIQKPLAGAIYFIKVIDGQEVGTEKLIR